MTLAQLRQAYANQVAQVRSVKDRIDASDAPAEADVTAFNTAAAEANRLGDEITAAETRDAAFTAMQTRAAQTDRVGQPAALMPHTDPKNTRNGRHSLSLMRILRCQLAAVTGGSERLDGLELETHEELVLKRGKAAVGTMFPLDAFVQYDGAVQTRDMTTSGGAGAIGKPVLASRMIDLLRPRMVLPALGATVITDMTGPFSLPKVTATVTVGHVTTEGTNASKSQGAIDPLDFTYKSVEATTKLTRQFINSASITAESWAVDQLNKAIAQTVENEAFNGPGTSKRVKGLFLYGSSDGVSVKVQGTNGDVPTWAGITAMTGMVDTANAPMAARKWLLNPATVSCFQSTPKVNGQPVYILGDSGQIAGYSYESTSQVLGNITKGSGSNLSQMAFGAWDEALVVLFSGIDIYIDPFSNQPHVNVTAALDYDVNFAHLQSFAICNDLKTS